MPPQFIKPDATNPNRYLRDADLDKSRGRLSRLLGGRVLNVAPPTEQVSDLNMNIAQTYGVDWDIEKCARDAIQNFFDANSGTLDGVAMELETAEGDSKPVHNVIIRGNSNYDYRDLTLLGATTKETGGLTAGGFGEGAKVLSLVLLRDFGVERVTYRSADWQLDFFIDDLPEQSTARPTRGLFARVATGLEEINGSEMMISCSDPSVADKMMAAKQLFRSSENPDFRNMTLEKTLSDGSQVGIKFLGVSDGKRPELISGNLYVAGQRREYNKFGDRSGWETVEGFSVYTTKDIAPGDRDRGGLSKQTLQKRLLEPVARQMSVAEVETFLRTVEPAYSSEILGLSELGDFMDAVLKRGKELGLSMEFDKKYIACAPFLPIDIRSLLQSQGLVLCPTAFSDIGMRTSNEAIRGIHEHQRIEPTVEYQKKITILQQALDMLDELSTKKQFLPKEVALYSQATENNPAHGTNSEEYVWIAVEHMQAGFPNVFATYLHELDHRYGSDQSSDFSYALTDTLTAILEVVSSDAGIAAKWQDLSRQWQDAKGDT